MKRFLKSYLVFTSLIYRIVMFVIMPIAIIVATFLIGIILMWMDTEPCVIVMLFLPMVEIVSDNWMFGGIQSKDVEKLDYLKTSGMGMNVLRRAHIIDLLRKFIWTVGIMGITYCMLMIYRDLNSPVLAVINPEDLIIVDGGAVGLNYQTKDFISAFDWGSLMTAVLITYFFSVAGTVLARFGSMLWLNLMIAYLSEILIVVCILGATLKFIIPFIILDVVISILAVRIVMKKVEGSYYDK